MAYSNKVLDHYNNPRNVGSFDKADVTVGTGVVGAPECGDVMKLWVKVDDGRIQDAKFKAHGCSAAIATSSYATEMLIGMGVAEARRITKEQIAEALGGLPASKIHCSVLASDAIKAVLKGF